MTDLREQIEDVLYREGVTPIPPLADAIMALMTFGARFTGADGREMVVVPVEPTRDMLDCAAGRPGMSEQELNAHYVSEINRLWTDEGISCPASRHTRQLAEQLARDGRAFMLEEEPRYCAGSMLATVAALYEARQKIRQLEASTHP